MPGIIECNSVGLGLVHTAHIPMFACCTNNVKMPQTPLDLSAFFTGLACPKCLDLSAFFTGTNTLNTLKRSTHAQPKFLLPHVNVHAANNLRPTSVDTGYMRPHPTPGASGLLTQRQVLPHPPARNARNARWGGHMHLELRSPHEMRLAALLHPLCAYKGTWA